MTATAYQIYKQYAKVLQELQESLRIRRTIFNNDVMIWLTTVVSKSEAIQMVDDQNHTNWTDTNVERALWEGLQTPFEPCLVLMSNPDQKLKDIEGEERKFANIVDQNNEGLSSSALIENCP